MSVIQKIFSGKRDEEIHSDFVKFSKGVFNDKYLVEAKKQKGRWNIKTGSEFANFLVRKCLEKTNGEIDIKGVIVATFHIKDDVDFPIEKLKQFMGIKQSVINSRISVDKILKLMQKYPRAFFALSFSTPDADLKIKAKAPKSAKPVTAGKKAVKVNFCSIKTSDPEIIYDLLFDCKNEDEVAIKHTIQINEIILPKDAKTPEEMRERAIRKGKIIRIIKTGEKEAEKETRKEVDFEA